MCRRKANPTVVRDARQPAATPGLPDADAIQTQVRRRLTDKLIEAACRFASRISGASGVRGLSRHLDVA